MWFVFRCTPLAWVLQRFWPPRAYVKIEHNDKILLVQNWMGSGKWSFPGGGVHRGEDTRAGACREVFEEVGLTLKPVEVKFLAKGFVRYVFGGKKFIVYGVTLSTKPKIVIDSELNDYVWVAQPEIKNYQLTSVAKVALGRG